MSEEDVHEKIRAAIAETMPKVQNAPRQIFWHSNAPWVGTGYGSQTALFAPRIAERLGYRMGMCAFYGLNGSRIAWPSPTSNAAYEVYPGGRDGHSNDVIGAHAKHFFGPSGGLVIMLTDPWVMDTSIISQIPTASWVPIDHEPLMPRTRDWFRMSGAIPIAMSKFGQEQLRKAGLAYNLYVPHGFDENIFKPMERAAARAELRIPQDAFVVGMVAANKGIPSRKGFAQGIKAVGQLSKDHNDVVLYMHTEMERPGGEELFEMCAFHGITPIVVDQYSLALGVPNVNVALTMNAFDVLLNPSHGEGFGVPLIEAQACGTPCITTNFSSMPEVAPVEHGNWSVDGEKTWTIYEAEQMIPNVGLLYEALTEAYEESEAAKLLRRKRVHLWAIENYEADWITDTYWKPVLDIAWRESKNKAQKLERY